MARADRFPSHADLSPWAARGGRSMLPARDTHGAHASKHAVGGSRSAHATGDVREGNDGGLEGRPPGAAAGVEFGSAVHEQHAAHAVVKDAVRPGSSKEDGSALNGPGSPKDGIMEAAVHITMGMFQVRCRWARCAAACARLASAPGRARCLLLALCRSCCGAARSLVAWVAWPPASWLLCFSLIGQHF
jgi:hypothetical protein